jgi:hypothetical protein
MVKMMADPIEEEIGRFFNEEVEISNNGPSPSIQPRLRIDRIVCKNYKELEECIKKGGDLNDFIFRGERNPENNLTSFLYRKIEKQINWNCNPGIIKQYYENVCKEFKDREIMIPGDGPEDRETISYLQHYGGITNYLDWTRDLKTACYFAFKDVLENQCECGHIAAIYAFNRHVYDNKKAKFDEEEIYLVEPVGKNNPNLQLQKGLHLATPIDELVMMPTLLEIQNNLGEKFITKYILKFSEEIRGIVLSIERDITLEGICLKHIEKVIKNAQS